MYIQSTQMHNICLEGNTNIGTFDTEQEAVNKVMNFFRPAGYGSQAPVHIHTITHSHQKFNFSMRINN